jgi:hypothetical protein
MIFILTILSITLLLAFIAGGYDSVLDTLVSDIQYKASKLANMPNQQWWNWFISGGNKWKNGDIKQGEKFFGSSTFLSWLTDAFHMFKALLIVTIFAIPALIIISIPLVNIDFSDFQWWYYTNTFICALIAYASCWGLGFEVTKKFLKA